MNRTSPYSLADIKNFSSALLRPRLAPDFLPFHKNRDLIRQRSNFVQLLALNGGRYGETLKVMPTFYVVGARPSDEVIPQSIALNAEHPNRWRFQDRNLDTELADEVCGLLKDMSPISFFSSIEAANIVAMLESASANSKSEDAPLFLAFFMMVNGISGERSWIERARRNFLKQNSAVVHEWQRTTLRRIDELEHRLNAPDAATLCQNEASEHAVRLNLPRVDWFAP